MLPHCAAHDDAGAGHYGDGHCCKLAAAHFVDETGSIVAAAVVDADAIGGAIAAAVVASVAAGATHSPAVECQHLHMWKCCCRSSERQRASSDSDAWHELEQDMTAGNNDSEWECCDDFADVTAAAGDLRDRCY